MSPAGNTDKLSHEEIVAALTEEGIILDASYESSINEEHWAIHEIEMDATRHAMQWIAVLPLIMAGCYLGLILYFRAKGGYRAIELTAKGEPTGEHAVTPAEVVADAEKTPSE